MAYKNHQPHFTCAIVVAHGDSEEIIAKHVRACLKLPIHIHKRKTSIQINGLVHELETNFKNVLSLNRNKDIHINVSKGKILNDFKIFTLMDTDDCTEKIKECYIDGSLFNGYALKDYVVPIYAISDMEEVLYKCKIIPKKFKDKEKVTGYKKVFDIPKPPYIESKVDELKKMSKTLEESKQTNLECFFNYCIEQSEKHKV
ncbi:MAG: hypothetical protein UH080_02965 [Ruminococcus sp.]|nr:hypothetical protein [Ruminococcus sp.]